MTQPHARDWVDGATALGVIGGVRLWLLDLDRPLADDAVRMLAPDEMARAARFVVALHRQRYCAAHVHLRALLAATVGCAPAALDLQPQRYGKPMLVAPRTAAPAFSLSHCEHLGLVGVADAGDVGVDIELARPIADIDALAQEHFTMAELAALQATPAGQREIAFLRGWTRKEACLKAVGSGLTATAEAGLSEGPGLAVVTTPHGRATVHVESVPLPAGAVAAVARVRDAERGVATHFGLRE